MSDQEASDEEWEDISSCFLQPKITADLQMAGGGSHAWWYHLEWDNAEDSQPTVYIKRLADNMNMELQQHMTLIVRHYKNNPGQQDVKLVFVHDPLPEEDDKYEYSSFFCPALSE